MNKYDSIYDTMKAVNEAKNRENFNAFMYGLESGIISDLDRFYVEDKSQYETLVSNVKKRGVRVFRNNEGKHKISF